MTIFPEQPEVSREDALRIHRNLSNRNIVRKWIRTNPDPDDLKRAVLIEVYRCVNSRRAPLTTMNRGVYADLMAAIMKRERSSIDEAVMDTITEAHDTWKRKNDMLVESNRVVSGAYLRGRQAKKSFKTKNTETPQ